MSSLCFLLLFESSRATVGSPPVQFGSPLVQFGSPLVQFGWWLVLVGSARAGAGSILVLVGSLPGRRIYSMDKPERPRRLSQPINAGRTPRCGSQPRNDTGHEPGSHEPSRKYGLHPDQRGGCCQRHRSLRLVVQPHHLCAEYDIFNQKPQLDFRECF